MYEKLSTINKIWQRAKCYLTIMSNASYLITVSDMTKIITFFSEISQQTLKIDEKIAIISQIWHSAKFCFTCFSSSWYQIMVPNMKEIHPVIMEECVRMD